MMTGLMQLKEVLLRSADGLIDVNDLVFGITNAENLRDGRFQMPRRRRALLLDVGKDLARIEGAVGSDFELCCFKDIRRRGVGKRSHAEARSRSFRARSSTARRCEGSRLLSSDFAMRRFPLPDKLQIIQYLSFLLIGEIEFRERGQSTMSFAVIRAFGGRDIARQFHQVPIVDTI
jgi:hypothetical protein